jgi:hypothetical protein
MKRRAPRNAALGVLCSRLVGATLESILLCLQVQQLCVSQMSITRPQSRIPKKKEHGIEVPCSVYTFPASSPAGRELSLLKRRAGYRGART